MRNFNEFYLLIFPQEQANRFYDLKMKHEDDIPAVASGSLIIDDILFC